MSHDDFRPGFSDCVTIARARPTSPTSVRRSCRNTGPTLTYRGSLPAENPHPTEASVSNARPLTCTTVNPWLSQQDERREPGLWQQCRLLWDEFVETRSDAIDLATLRRGAALAACLMGVLVIVGIAGAASSSDHDPTPRPVAIREGLSVGSIVEATSERAGKPLVVPTRSRGEAAAGDRIGRRVAGVEASRTNTLRPNKRRSRVRPRGKEGGGRMRR